MSEGEIEYEAERRREEIADEFESLAEALRGGGEIDLQIGERSVTIAPPESVEYEIEVEDEWEDDRIERSLEIELEWERGDHEEPIEEEEEE